MKLTKYLLVSALLVGAAATDADAQVKNLSGKVTEIFNGKTEVMVGVNINIVNSQNRSLVGAITDLNGNFNISVPDEKNLTIEISYIGKKTVRIKYTGQSRLDVKLDDATQEVSEVVITANRLDRNSMGISSHEQVSATQKVNLEELVAVAPVTSLEDALQGQLGGVDIVLGGGDPGARASIQIRGTSTLNANSDPLIVIDGIPYPSDISDDTDFSNLDNDDLGALLNISPQDIASVEVLKDAAATAIWGTKGANGVLMITTKKGTVGKTRFSFSTKYSAKFEPESIPMLNGDQYTALLQEAIWNSANYSGFNTTYLDLLNNTPEIGEDPNFEYYNEYHQNTNWLDEVKRNTYTWENNFSMSGGGERATYRFALGYLDEGGTTIGTGFNRLNSSLDITYRFSDRLKFNAYFSYTQSDRDNNYFNIRKEAFRKMPNKSPYYIDPETGLRTDQYFSRYNTESTVIDAAPAKLDKTDDARNYNPIALANDGEYNTLQRESKMNFNVEYKILPELTYKAYISLNIRNQKDRKFLPQTATGLAWTDSYSNLSTDASSDLLSINSENQLMFIKNWTDKHKIIANAIFRTTDSRKAAYNSMTYGNASSDLSDPIMGSTVQKLTSSDTEERTLSGILAFNYTLLNRYVFNATVNMEGNSSMGKSERWGTFPAGGFAWHIAEEPFMRNIDWLSELKLRFSVGQSGRSASGTGVYIGAFEAGDNYMDMSGIKPTTMQLNRLKWETTTEYNTGLDISVLHNRLRFTFDVYQRYTRDLLQKDVKVPTTTGYGEYKLKYYNSGEMTNKGWEFRTDFTAYENKDWRVSGYFNISRNVNKITELPINKTDEEYTFDNGNYAIRNEVGRPQGSFYGYRYLGVYQNKEATYARDAEGNVMKDIEGQPIVMRNGTAVVAPGDAIYEDINHDGVINQYDIVYLGSAQPRFFGGAGLTVSWKSLKLTANFYGRYGMNVVNQARMDNEAMYNADNQSTAVLRRWRNEGDQTDIPRALYNQGYNYLGSDRFVEDASYLRLKSLSLTYRFPKALSQRLRMNTVDVYVTGYNLFTWTKYTGQDPEVKPSSTLTKDTAMTPASIQFTCGVNLNF